jgi:hypothetical protein
MHDWDGWETPRIQREIDDAIKWRDQRRHFWVGLMAKLRLVL